MRHPIFSHCRSLSFLAGSFLFGTGVLATTLATPTYAEDGVAWRNVSDGEEEASVRDLPVLYFFTADWCSPCDRMKKDAFMHPKVLRLIREGFVPVEVLDRKTEEGSNIEDVDRVQMRFLVQAFPTIVVARPLRGHAVTEAGMLSAQGMLRFLEEAPPELSRLERTSRNATLKSGEPLRGCEDPSAEAVGGFSE